MEATSAGDVALALTAIDGYLEGEADADESDTESMAVVVPFDGPYFLTLDSFAPTPVDAVMTANFPLRPLVDPDDETTVFLGDVVYGYADYRRPDIGVRECRADGSADHHRSRGERG